MQKIIQTLRQIPSWIHKFQVYIQMNNLSSNLSAKLQSQNIESLSKHLLKLQQENKEKHKISWVSSQYQVLEIVLNCMSVISQKVIEDFNSTQWSQIYMTFPYKVPLTIKYESLRTVMEKKQPRRRWVASEQNFLIEIVRSFSKKNKWNDVARELFIKSDGQFFRQGKHCRQRWLNHLHPSIQNNDWSPYEDLQLLQFVLKKGKKWARMAKKFEMKRSQCMVKKRFFQLIKTQQQDTLSIETLKGLIKASIQQINSSMLPEKVEQNLVVHENNNIKIVDNRTIQSSKSGSSIIERSKEQNNNEGKQHQGEILVMETNKMGSDGFQDQSGSDGGKLHMEQEQILFGQVQKDQLQQQQLAMATTIAYQHNHHSQLQLDYCLNYFSYMAGMFSSTYPCPYQSIIIPVQNNIFISPPAMQQQSSHQEMKY